MTLLCAKRARKARHSPLFHRLCFLYALLTTRQLPAPDDDDTARILLRLYQHNPIPVVRGTRFLRAAKTVQFQLTNRFNGEIPHFTY